jgi:hypothetical protein
MPLFGPLGSMIYGDAPLGVSSGLYGVDPDAVDYAMRIGVPRPLLPPSRFAFPFSQPTALNTAPPALPATTLALPPPPLPAMQSLGTFTTRRTELFGPLSAVSI